MQTTSIDPTEETRRALVVQVNAQPAQRAELAARYGQVWNTSALGADFEVFGFAALFVVVKRKADQKLGSLLFQHQPRSFFAFQEDP
jgi:hypothetical protein